MHEFEYKWPSASVDCCKLIIIIVTIMVLYFVFVAGHSTWPSHPAGCHSPFESIVLSSVKIERDKKLENH